MSFLSLCNATAGNTFGGKGHTPRMRPVNQVWYNDPCNFVQLLARTIAFVRLGWYYEWAYSMALI